MCKNNKVDSFRNILIVGNKADMLTIIFSFLYHHCSIILNIPPTAVLTEYL